MKKKIACPLLMLLLIQLQLILHPAMHSIELYFSKRPASAPISTAKIFYLPHIPLFYGTNSRKIQVGKQQPIQHPRHSFSVSMRQPRGRSDCDLTQK